MAERHVGEEVHVVWDEPGAGGIVINGHRVIDFNVRTDWSDAWNPQVNRVGLRLLDVLPRLVQERENAYATARRYSDEARHALAALEQSGGHSEGGDA